MIRFCGNFSFFTVLVLLLSSQLFYPKRDQHELLEKGKSRSPKKYDTFI
jgi:hypothetical protein